MPKITINTQWTGAVLFEHDVSDEVQAGGRALSSALEAAAKSFAKLSSADLSGANLSGANLSSVNLSSADLSSADLSGANLSSVNLSSADLSSADLSGANLRGANLSSVNLSNANLHGANLSGAYLNSSDLSGANLSSVNLSNADLSSADLSGANLRGAKIKTGLELSGPRPALFIGPIGSEQRMITAWITEDGLRIQAGCFFGTRDEFTAQLAKTHGNNEHAQEYTAALVLIDMHAKLWAPAGVKS